MAFLVDEELEILAKHKKYLIAQLSCDLGHHDGSGLCREKFVSLEALLAGEHVDGCNYFTKVRNNFSKISGVLGKDHMMILAIGENSGAVVKQSFSKIFDLPEDRIYNSTPVLPEDQHTGEIGKLARNQNLLFVVKTVRGLEYFGFYLDLLRKNNLKI